MSPEDIRFAGRGRLTSLDAFRGLTMFLLVAEGAGLYHSLQNPAFEGSILGTMVIQFTHHPWHGLRFWDLIQPFFMFIVGVAMPFSIGKRLERGDSWGQVFRHVLYRSGILFLFGVILHCGYSGRLVWELWNVLTQLSFTYPVAFLLMRKRPGVQIGVSLALLAAMESLYRLWPIPGFDQPFVKDHNFGSYMDLVLMGKLNDGGGWVAMNCVPTAAHTIWGVLAGQILRSERREMARVKILLLAGAAGIVAGYSLDPVTPIIKRICTSSFVIVSGGWCLVALALFYWLIEVREHRRWATFAVIVGMNPIFIYMFTNTAGEGWLNGFVAIFVVGFLGWMGAWAGVVSAAAVLFLEWYLCWWLYRRKIFLKI